MIVRYWGHKARRFSWYWQDAKIGKRFIASADADGYSIRGFEGGAWSPPVSAVTECEPEIRDAHHRIAAGGDLAWLATHTLSRIGAFLPIPAPDAVADTENAQIGNIQQEGLFA